MDVTPSRSQVASAVFDRARIARLSVAAIILYVLLAAGFLATARNGVDALGIPLGFDFLAFHGGARLAVEGRLAEAFDPHVFQAALERQLPGVGFGYYWLYPPAFAVMILPFGWLPYGAAFWAFTALGLGAYGASVWTLTRDRLAVLAAFAFPACWVAAYHGQNSFFAAALVTLACHSLLNRKEARAGLFIGLLAFKPHLAVLFPLALACAGRWRTFLWAAATALLTTAAGVGVLGTAYLDAYLTQGLANAAGLIEEARHWPTLTSAYAALRLAGAAPSVAGAAQGAVALLAALLVGLGFRKQGVTRETLALLCAASLLISPYVMDYDLMLLAPAGLLLFCGRDAAPAARWAGFAAALIPMLVVGLGREGVQIGWASPLLAMAAAAAQSPAPPRTAFDRRAQGVQ